MENCWEHLGIDPTADTAAIKKAYAKQLKFNKPDKNPKGFQDLRVAYEQALNESYWYEEEEEDFVENDDVENDLAEEVILAEPDIVLSIVPDMIIADGADTELANLVDTHIEQSQTQHDDIIEPDASAAVDAIDEDSMDVLPYFEEANSETAATEEEDFRIPDLEEDILDHYTFTASYWPPSHWTVEWQQIAEDDESDTTKQDQRLQALLQSQLDTTRSLDTQNDFEETLLVWLAEQPPLFPLSYRLAKNHFRWDNRLEHWSHNDYPWYMLESLDQRYQHATYFQSPTAFYEYLTHRFPMIASYLPLESLSEIKNEYVDPSSLKRMSVFKRLFFPFRVTELAQELRALDTELDYYIYDHPAASQLTLVDTLNDSDKFTVQYWQQNSSFTTIRGWILHRFIQPRDFIVLVVVIPTVLGVLSRFPQQPWQNFYNDGFGVFAALSLYYLFWQLQLRLFATPDRFVSFEPWSTGWRNASILFFILGYISWLDTSNLDSLAMITSPVYFLTHLAGASLFAANSIRQSNIVVTVITWHAGLMLVVLAVLIPKLVIITAPPPYSELETFPISPLFWLLLATPAFFVSLSDTYPRLEWLANIGYKLLTIWQYLMLIGVFVLYAYCVDVLFEMNFGITAITIMIIAITMIIGMYKFLNTFEVD